MQEAQLKPAGDNNTFFQKFEFNAGVKVLKEKNELVLRGDAKSEPVRFEVEKDFAPLSFTENQTVDAEVVFVGYGLSVPGKGAEGYDSYAGVDVKNKIALVLRYVPEEVDPKRRQELNRYAGLRYKAMLAREHGAKAVLFVTGPNSPNAGELVAASFDASMANSGIVAASISSNVADALFQRAGKDLKSLQSALDKENPHAESGFTLPNVTVHLATAVEHIRKDDRNVIAVLPPSGPPERAEYVVIGAHYDHLGFGETGAMQRKGEEGKIHPGADDNASGTAAVLELAASLAEERKAKPEEFRRGIVFAFWSGEEIGMIGSSYFVEHPTVPLSNVVAYVNFDMVGRLRENKLSLQGVGSSNAWRRLIEKRNVAAGFNLSLQEDPYLPTDVTAFYPKGVPVLNFFTGGHDDYHRPTDTADKLDYDGLERITKFARALVVDLAKGGERPDYVKVQHKRRSRRPRNLARLPRHDSRLRHRSGGRETLRRPRRQPGGKGGFEGRRRHRRVRRPESVEHLRLHLRARRGQDWPAGGDRGDARRPAREDHGHAGGEEVGTARARGIKAEAGNQGAAVYRTADRKTEGRFGNAPLLGAEFGVVGMAKVPRSRQIERIAHASHSEAATVR